MVAVGGIFGGLALAFLIELFLDRSVKRPTDIETKLRLPLFISIPAIASNGHRHLATTGKPIALERCHEQRDVKLLKGMRPIKSLAWILRIVSILPPVLRRIEGPVDCVF